MRKVSKRFLVMSSILLAVILLMGCSPSPRVMLEDYLEGKSPKESPFLETSTDENLPCPEMLTGWLDEAQLTGLSWQRGEAIHIMAVYTVEGDDSTLFELPSAPADYKTWQVDAYLHEQAWALITGIIPLEYRSEVTRLIIFTDGPAGALGAVEESSQPGEWTLSVDIQDAGDLPTFAATLIHETAHLLSLGTTQVDTFLPLFEHPEDEALFEQGKAACDTYFVPEGCSLPGSYLAQFFETYWNGIMDEWTGIQREKKDVDKYTRLLAKLYDHHADEFVSSYAVTSPEEDLAESFLYYVLSDEPSGKTIADNKIRFFNEFPELVDLRQQIRTNLCTIVSP